MIDPALLRDDLEGVRSALQKRGVDLSSELEELADDVVFLHDGKVEFAGPIAEIKSLTRQNNLERAIAAMMVRGAAA